MHLRTLFLFTVAFVMFASPASVQAGTVTFYFAQPGIGLEVADGLLPFGKVRFTGFLDDGGSEWRMSVEDRL